MQGLERFVATLLMIAYLLVLWILPGKLGPASQEAGPVISRTPAIIQHILWMQGTLSVGPPFAYILVVGLNGFTQPRWMQQYSLPDHWAFGTERYAAIRIVGALCVAIVLPAGAMACTRALGSQYALIGVRKKAVIVSSGPYAYVRHPLYTVFFLVQPFLAAALWLWIPFYALALMILPVILKIYYEEELIMERSDVALAYANYRRKVPYRLIPFVW